MDAISLATLLEPAIDLVTVVVVGFGLYFAIRQRLTQYRDARAFLVLSWLLFLGVALTQLAQDIYQTVALSKIYNVVAVPLILADAAILSLLSYAIYARESEPGLLGRVRAMLRRRNLISGLVLIAFTGYLGYVIFYLLSSQPFTIVPLVNVFGAPTDSALFAPGFLLLLFLVLVGYLGYACVHLLLAARRMKDRSAARALRVFLLGWIATGSSLFVSSFSVNFGVDLTAVCYFIVAISFSASASVFRRESSLAGFFEATKPMGREANPFTGRMATGKPSSHASGRGIMLLEFDPSSNYLDVVRDFAVEQIADDNSLFVFTSKGKPIYKALQQVSQARFFIMTRGVTYPKPGSRPDEVLVPQGEDATLLRVLERTLTANPESKISFVFDSVSDLIITSGLDKTYKFLKLVLEMAARPGVAALFLLIEGAHDDRAINLVRSLFGRHLVFDGSGLKVKR